MSINKRQKGQLLEKHVSDLLISKGLDGGARPSWKSGGTNSEKADIWTSTTLLGQNLGIECKNQKTIHFEDWWRQTKKLEKLSREPVLVLKPHNTPLGDSVAVIYLDTFLEMIKRIKELEKQCQNQ